MSTADVAANGATATADRPKRAASTTKAAARTRSATAGAATRSRATPKTDQDGAGATAKGAAPRPATRRSTNTPRGASAGSATGRTKAGALAGAPTPAIPATRARRAVSPAEAPAGRLIGELLADLGTALPDDVLLAAYEQELGDARRLGEILVADGRVAPDMLEQALALQQVERAQARPQSHKRVRQPAQAAIPAAPDAEAATVHLLGEAVHADGEWRHVGRSHATRYAVAAVASLLLLAVWLTWISPPLAPPAG